MRKMGEPDSYLFLGEKTRRNQFTIRNLKERFEEKCIPVPECGCWIWLSTINKYSRGYGRFLHNGKQKLAHRMAWELYKGKIPKRLFVLHSCDTPSCVNPHHLFLGTSKDNMCDCLKKGRRPSKLTKEQIPQIRNMIKDGYTQTSIANYFNVSQQTVSRRVALK